MTGLKQSSAIAAYLGQADSMRRSHDENGSIQMYMYSLGVIDLDMSISPDVFGLRAIRSLGHSLGNNSLLRCVSGVGEAGASVIE